jgi:hypothetical protein
MFTLFFFETSSKKNNMKERIKKNELSINNSYIPNIYFIKVPVIYSFKLRQKNK